MWERERELDLKPDHAIDGYLRATAVAGKRQNAVTHFIIRVLGLEVRGWAPSYCMACWNASIHVVSAIGLDKQFIADLLVQVCADTLVGELASDHLNDPLSSCRTEA